MLNILIWISNSCVERQDCYHFPGMVNFEIVNLPFLFKKNLQELLETSSKE